MKERAHARLKIYIVLLSVCLAYLIYLNLGFSPVPCPFRLITGLKCPGCGVTHMILHIERGKISAAIKDNAFLFICSPVIVILVACSEYRYIRYGSRKSGRLFSFLSWFLVISGIIFAIIRNIKL